MRYVNGKSFSKQRHIVQPDLLVDKKTVESQDWAIRPLDHCGLWAAGPVVTKGRNDLQSPTTIYNHLEKFNDLVVITTHKQSNTILKKP